MTRKGTGKSREHQLTHQLTCRTPRAPCHCRAGSVVDVAATGFPVTDECSGLFPPLVHPSVSVFIINLLLPLERNEVLPSCPSASSRTCWVSLPYFMRSQPRGGTPQQAHACSRFLHYWTSLCTHVLSRHTQRVYRPAGREGERRATRQTCGSLSHPLDLSPEWARSPIHCHRFNLRLTLEVFSSSGSSRASSTSPTFRL